TARGLVEDEVERRAGMIAAAAPVVDLAASVGGIGAESGLRIATAGHVTWIGRRAGHRVAARADAGLARIGLRAGVGIVAGRAVWRRGVRALSIRRVARARDMALVGCSAGHRVAARADAGLASVGLRAGIGVVAGSAVGPGRVRAH